MRTHLIVSVLIVVARRRRRPAAAGDPAGLGLVSRAFTMRYKSVGRPHYIHDSQAHWLTPRGSISARSRIMTAVAHAAGRRHPRGDAETRRR